MEYLPTREIQTEESPVRRSDDYPSKLFVEVTTRCNLNCGMCVKQNTPGWIPEGDMSEETFAALKPAFSHVDSLILNGIGEPLLHPRLEDYIRTAKEFMPPDGRIGFQSNGMLLTEDRALLLTDAGLDLICLSLDAVSHDGFRRIREGGEVTEVRRAFDALARAKTARGRDDLRVGFEFVVRKDNLWELTDTIRWAASQGATFALVSQLLPYDRALAPQAVYDTNTWDAISVYRQWVEKIKAEGLDPQQYIGTFMKYFKDDQEERLFSLMDQMKSDALSRDIALHMERLLTRDEAWFEKVEEVFGEARRVAEDVGISITLPEIAPRNTRRCEFVEGRSGFVSWDGNVHPCYFLWHSYGCYVGGWEKQVTPLVFGNLSDRDIGRIWSSADFRSFRERVLRYDFPFCFDCGFALCDLAQRADFDQDCYTNAVPCGACLWCTGLFHCLQ